MLYLYLVPASGIHAIASGDDAGGGSRYGQSGQFRRASRTARTSRTLRPDQREEQRVRARRAAGVTEGLSDADLARLFPFYPAAKPTVALVPDVPTQQEMAQDATLVELDPGLLIAMLAAFDEDL